MPFLNLLLKNILLALHLDNKTFFPKPLSAKEEQKYLELLKAGDKKAKDILIVRNLRLVAHITKKYYSFCDDSEELLSVGSVGLVKAVNSYDPDKGVRLATYAARCIDNEILMYFRNKKKCALDISFDEPIETDPDGNPLTLTDIICNDDNTLEEICLSTNCKRVLRYVDEIEDPRDRTIIILRYGLNGKPPLKQSEVAKLYKISRSYVSRIETRCLKKLRKRFESEKSI